ncbi:MAG: undecaprenyldiphospho-muramoylpentapeptide beta-N-acetylglucosaminyltransferase [Magnetococcales bacterium]|nr:undecaprenyldiphospho-muramoylpentapeptide beta-N-acetylglucosaminyltransferase [Magnetococcales bacterium]
MTTQGKRLIIAGGGTGGHIFPAIAIADAWEAQGGEVLFVGTPHGLESRLLPERGKRLALLTVGQIKGKGLSTRLRTLLGLPGALWSAGRIIRAYRPDVVLGMGGYVSAPTVVAARLLAIPTALHEQNARPGLTNRLLGKLTDRVFVSFAEAIPAFQAAPADAAAVPGGRVLLTGNPVRAALQAASPSDARPLGQRPFRLLVFGGSQGARIFSDRLPPTLQQLKAHGMAVAIRHQVPQADLDTVRAEYERLGITAVVEPFIQDMAEAYREADLVICRAGATTVAELAMMGKPALFIPYPFAADDHQTANALAMVRVNGGWMQPQSALTADWLTAFLQDRMADPAGLLQASQGALSLATPQAAQRILDHLLALVGTKR